MVYRLYDEYPDEWPMSAVEQVEALEELKDEAFARGDLLSMDLEQVNAELAERDRRIDGLGATATALGQAVKQAKADLEQAHRERNAYASGADAELRRVEAERDTYRDALERIADIATPSPAGHDQPDWPLSAMELVERLASNTLADYDT